MTTPYDCEATVRRLWPHLDGQLTTNDRAKVVAHLTGCATCTSHFDYAREFLMAVRQAAPQLADHGRIAQRVLGALALEGFRDGAR